MNGPQQWKPSGVRKNERRSIMTHTHTSSVPHPAKSKAGRVLLSSLSSLSLPLLSLALARTAGCKSNAGPPDDASLGTAVQTRITSDSALANEPIQPSVQN